MRLRLLSLLLALLPGLTVAGVADMRVCLYALTGAGGCCISAESEQEGCCVRAQPAGVLLQPPQGTCEFCCVEVAGEPVAVQGIAPQAELPPLALSTLALPAWSAPASAPRTQLLPESPPPRPGVAAKLPLRI